MFKIRKIKLKTLIALYFKMTVIKYLRGKSSYISTLEYFWCIEMDYPPVVFIVYNIFCWSYVIRYKTRKKCYTDQIKKNICKTYWFNCFFFLYDIISTRNLIFLHYFCIPIESRYQIENGFNISLSRNWNIPWEK